MEIVNNNQKKSLLDITVIEEHVAYKNLLECRERLQLEIRNKSKLIKMLEKCEAVGSSSI